MAGIIVGVIAGVAALVVLLLSIKYISAREIGLVTKHIGVKKLEQGNIVAFNGEVGYQAELLMPGLRFKLWPIYSINKFPWVQVSAGEIGVVIAQVGAPLPVGAKSAHYKPEFGDFRSLETFVENGGQKGVQRPVLPPGTVAPMHPVGFLVITKGRVYGRPVTQTMVVGGRSVSVREEALSSVEFGLDPSQLEVVQISPQPYSAKEYADVYGASYGGFRDIDERKVVDTIGVVTTLEGDPLPSGDIAGRLGGFQDVAEMETAQATDVALVEVIIGSKNNLHNNYQDFQAFLDNGGRIGLQHDPLLYGAYNLNPFLVRVQKYPMLVVEQGEVAVIKSYVGLDPVDVSGEDFRYGSLVRPGHRGVWREALRTGKYAINPHCYQSVIVPTAILTLNWAEATSRAHQLDKGLSQIRAKSREGFVFGIDLQVQIHIAYQNASRVISAMGTMQNLVDEVLQAAVGNHFRDKLQSMPAVSFIETRQQVQEEAYQHIQKHLAQYLVETIGVYIQDVVLPNQLVAVLTEREIANQEVETYKKQELAQQQRILVENASGTADQQRDLARSKVGVTISENDASAMKAKADGEATYIERTGTARGAEVRAVGLARAEAYERQVAALGQEGTSMVNMVTALAERGLKFVPEILVSSGDGGGGITGALMGIVNKLGQKSPDTAAATNATPKTDTEQS